MSDTFLRLKCPKEPAFFKSRASYSTDDPAIAKASFQVIGIYLGQRDFPFNTSQVIQISSVASSEKTLKILPARSFIVLYIIRTFCFFYGEGTACPA